MTRLFKGLSQLHGHSDDDDVGVDDDDDLDDLYIIGAVSL